MRSFSGRVDTSKARPLIAGFLAGFLSTLAFHQVMLMLLNELGLTARPAFVIHPTYPFAVPAVLSAAFWGGLWGIVLTFVLRPIHSAAQYWLIALLFGTFATTLVSWFIVSPLKGMPIAAGWRGPPMATTVFVNAAWATGTALLLHWWFSQQRRAYRRDCDPASDLG